MTPKKYKVTVRFKHGSHISWHDFEMELKGHIDRALISEEFAHLHGLGFSYTVSQISRHQL